MQCNIPKPLISFHSWRKFRHISETRAITPISSVFFLNIAYLFTVHLHQFTDLIIQVRSEVFTHILLEEMDESA